MSQTLLPLYDQSVEPHVRVADFYFDAKTQVIYFLKSIENRKVKFSTRVKVPEIAKAKREANRLLTRRIHHKKYKPTTFIKDELEAWVAVKATEGLDASTLAVVRRNAKRIAEYWGDMESSEIKRDNMPAWFVWWAENYPGQTKYNAIKYLRNFCRYLVEKGKLPAIPTIKDPNARSDRTNRKRNKERIPTAPEFAKIIETASSSEEALIVRIMGTMATRIEETCTLRFGHEILLDQATPGYRWREGQNKADLEGEHMLHQSLIEPLRALRTRRLAEGTVYLFPQKFNNQRPIKPQQIDWAQWRIRADLGWHWTSHIFRHMCLTNLFSDPKLPQVLICKQYRVSLKVALEVYIKATETGLQPFKDALPESL